MAEGSEAREWEKEHFKGGAEGQVTSSLNILLIPR